MTDHSVNHSVNHLMNPLMDTIRRHKAGKPVGIYSVCSASELVIEAAVLQAVDDESYLLVEATSNQVDQYGGYTGMKPADFRGLVMELAARHGLAEERVVLGGDHLGPNRWQDSPAEEAMGNAEGLIEAYVAAGFTKIHLDCSMPCADDSVPLGDEVVAKRAARLARLAERTAELTAEHTAGCAAGQSAKEATNGQEDPAASEILYVVGTEVPTPGGAQEELEEITPTDPDAAQETLERHRQAFEEASLEDAWGRVIALVVQPGVEFDLLHVVDYERDATDELRRVLDDYDKLVYEAHSTDYQKPKNLKALVEDHWAILKVGPGLTFAMREALFALAAIENELVPEGQRSELLAVIEHRMLSEPGQWEDHYGDAKGDAKNDPRKQQLLRRYSYSDRIRYYWSDPEIQAAQSRLFENLVHRDIPLPLLSQHLPDQYARVREGRLSTEPKALVLDRVQDVLGDYSLACTPTEEVWEDGASNTAKAFAENSTEEELA